MIKQFFIRMLRGADSLPPIRTLFFSETKDSHLIGKQIKLFKTRFLIEDVVLASWLKKRDINKYVPLYAIRGRKIELAGNGGGLCDDDTVGSKGRI